ncbi:hypothetical protein D3C87_1526830 [compost metagenome]
MHEFEDGTSDEIDAQTLRGAIKVVAWHLLQYRQRFAPLSQMERDAQEVEDRISNIYYRWEKTHGVVDGSELARQLPPRLRPRDKLFSILLELEAQNKVVVTERAPRGWSVKLSHWFGEAQHPTPWQGGGLYQRLPDHLRRHNERERKAAEAQKKADASRAQSSDGYQLWPGCFLP